MSSLSQEDKELIRQLNRHPDLKKRVKSIVSIASDDGDGIVKADEAENRVIEEVRRMGNEALAGWAESRIEKSGEGLLSEEKTVRSGKKKSVGTVRSVKST
jgi:ethanolamine utilization microcompartment shell protein EutL